MLLQHKHGSSAGRARVLESSHSRHRVGTGAAQLDGHPGVVRFAIPANDSRLRALVARLDDDELPMAETWRRVGAAGVRLGLLRPGYHVVRRLVQQQRLLRRVAAARVREAWTTFANLAAAGRFREAEEALERLGEALHHRHELVLQQHKPP